MKKFSLANNIIFQIFLCLALIIASLPVVAEKAPIEKRRYEIGIFPHLSKTHLQKTYKSVVQSLSENIDREIHFDANESIANFYQHLNNEFYDIVMVQPFEYIKLEKKYGYTPLAAQNRPLKGLIVAKKGSAIQNIQNLLGRKLSLPPDSTAVSYLSKKRLHDFGFDLNRDLSIRYEGTHVACLQKLLLGFTDSCATLQAALDFFEKRMEVRFNVITQTIAIPHTLFAVHPRVNNEDKEILTQALLNWSTTPAGKKLLKNKGLMPFRRVTDEEYDIVRQVKTEVDAY